MIKKALHGAALFYCAVYPLYWVVDYISNQEYDLQNYSKFSNAIKDIKANGILNAFMAHGKSRDEAIQDILKISMYLKNHSATYSYDSELLKSLAEEISGVKYHELEARQDMHNLYVNLNNKAIQYIGMRALVSDYNFVSSIYQKNGSIDYKKLDHIIMQGNDDDLYDYALFDLYSIHNSQHVIEDAFIQAPFMHLEAQIEDLCTGQFEYNATQAF
ncbi:MAG: hypothetical protein LW826_03200 [Candidatus Jidaibacter sp.]|nr:hypothetical protein [Candidatus Jidaibacter sp.]